jgi:hypothetical protein
VPAAIIPGNKRRVSSVSATILTCNISPVGPESIRSKRPSAPTGIVDQDVDVEAAGPEVIGGPRLPGFAGRRE